MNPIIQFRESPDGTWSVMARVYNPRKKFYEHPVFINLTREEVGIKREEIENMNLTNEQIEKEWVFFGD